MLDLAQVRTLLLAERSRDVAVITDAVDAGSPVYLIGKPELTIVVGMPAWRSALDRLGMSPEANRQALAGKTPATYGSRKEMGRWRPIRLPGDKG